MNTNIKIDPEDLQELQQLEHQRRDSLSRAAATTMTILLLIFSVKDAITGQTLVSFVISSAALLNILVMAIHSRKPHLIFFSAYLILCAGLLVCFLVSVSSGIIWLPSFPILVFSIIGARQATVVTSIMLVITAAILFIPNNGIFIADHSFHLRAASIGSYVFVTIFSYFQARERENAATSIARLNVELKQIASTDELTKLSNRRDMDLRLEFESKRAQRLGTHFSIIMCDIDYFKKINDNFGHTVGDQALKVFANILASRFRETDQVGRWGGEEFLIILPDTTLDQAINLANEVRMGVCKASILENMPNRLVTMSAGVACSSETYSPSELILLADKHLYTAKNSGRNRVKPDQPLPGSLSL